MKLIVESMNRRVTARRIGAGDWQDVADGFHEIGLRLEDDPEVDQILFDLTKALPLFTPEDAKSLVELFCDTVRPSVRIALAPPADLHARAVMSVFVRTLAERGYAARLCHDVEEADRLLRDRKAWGDAYLAMTGSNGPGPFTRFTRFITGDKDAF